MANDRDLLGGAVAEGPGFSADASLDFSEGDGSDILDLADVLTGEPGADNIDDYVKAINHKLVRDAADLKSLGVNSVAIMSNDPAVYPEDSFDNMKAVAEQFGYPFPYLYDESQGTAKAYGAVCTPDFFGYNSRLELQYRGRLDESGREPDTGDVRRDLFLAMKQVAETGRGPEHQIASIGCSIKWREQDS